jgi:hypothetical protein
MKEETMINDVKKTKTQEHYLVLDNLSYFKNGQIVTVNKTNDDVFLNVDDVPEQALKELVERELVKVLTL